MVRSLSLSGRAWSGLLRSCFLSRNIGVRSLSLSRRAELQSHSMSGRGGLRALFPSRSGKAGSRLLRSCCLCGLRSFSLGESGRGGLRLLSLSGSGRAGSKQPRFLSQDCQWDTWYNGIANVIMQN